MLTLESHENEGACIAMTHLFDLTDRVSNLFSYLQAAVGDCYAPH